MSLDDVSGRCSELGCSSEACVRFGPWNFVVGCEPLAGG